MQSAWLFLIAALAASVCVAQVIVSRALAIPGSLESAVSYATLAALFIVAGGILPGLFGDRQSRRALLDVLRGGALRMTLASLVAVAGLWLVWTQHTRGEHEVDLFASLAEGSELLPADSYDRAKAYEWMFWEQYSHEPYVAVCRFAMVYEKKSAEEREYWRVERGELALNLMEQSLEGRDWFVGEALSIADIALVAYTRLAHEGGFDLQSRPRLRNWIGRVEDALGIS